MYFSAFLAVAQPQVVLEKILPQIQFIMNRSKNFMGINATVIMFLKSYKIEDMETLTKWTTDVLPDQLLLSLDQKEEVTRFVTRVFGICSESHDMKQALITDILIEKFKQSKRRQQQFVSPQQRQRLLHLALALITSESGDRHVSHDLLQVVLEHFFQIKEENELLDIAQIVYRYVELATPQDAWEILLPLIQK